MSDDGYAVLADWLRAQIDQSGACKCSTCQSFRRVLAKLRELRTEAIAKEDGDDKENRAAVQP